MASKAYGKRSTAGRAKPSMLGSGLARSAGSAISGRQRQIDAQLERMYRGQSSDSNN